MVAADVAAVEAIERDGFINPYPPNTFTAQLALPHARVTVAERAGAIVGFCNYWLIADELQLLAIGTHRAHLRTGVAQALFAEMGQAAAAVGASTALLEVRADNSAAIKLYQRYGFVQLAIRRVYYSDGQDAVVMQASLPWLGNVT
jgi:ribosomal-protein-alanine N-acetyltransferase